MSFAAIILIACVIDVLIGWPDRIYRRIGHPVTWMGTLITRLETALNTGEPRRRFITGAVVLFIVSVAAGGVALVLQRALPVGWVGVLLGGLLAWPFIAIRSMHDHVKAVQTPLTAGDIETARGAVSMIVGRDPSKLDQKGIARSAMESLAENTSDGIIAPVFWGVLLGLPGLVIYKAINTLDSMIGHRNARYEHFGKAAARVDDVVNLVPARVTGVIFALVSSHPKRALGTMWSDASAHRSPNAGWPEAAMAGALNVRLSGPRVYGDHVAEEPWLNAGAPDPTPTDLERSLALFRRAMVAMMAGVAALVVVGL